MKTFTSKITSYGDDLAANQRSKAKLAYKIIIFVAATVKLLTEVLHYVAQGRRPATLTRKGEPTWQGLFYIDSKDTILSCRPHYIMKPDRFAQSIPSQTLQQPPPNPRSPSTPLIFVIAIYPSGKIRFWYGQNPAARIHHRPPFHGKRGPCRGQVGPHHTASRIL